MEALGITSAGNAMTMQSTHYATTDVMFHRAFPLILKLLQFSSFSGSASNEKYTFHNQDGKKNGYLRVIIR